jgi:hypothetical protein
MAIEPRLDRLESALTRLAEAQAKTEERIERLEDAFARLTERVGALAAEVSRLTVQLSALVGTVGDMRDVIGTLRGDVLEARYARRAAAYFAPLIRRIHWLASFDIAELTDPGVAAGIIADDEAVDALRADLVLRGVEQKTGQVGYLVVEVSALVDRQDVVCASDRASVLRRATGAPVVPVVAGEGITPEAAAAAQERGVATVLDGKVTL